MVSIRSINKKKLIKVAFVGAMTAPAIIGFLVFYVYVNFNSIVMAFQVNDFGKLHFGFNNFSFFFNIYSFEPLLKLLLTFSCFINQISFTLLI